MRRAFHFRLERIARVRELLEQQARNQLLAVRQEHARLAELLSQAESNLDEARRAARALQGAQALDPRAVLCDERAEAALELAIDRARLAERTARAALDLAAAQHQATLQDKKALERLSSRDETAHQQELAAHDEGESEERALLRRPRPTR